MGGCGLHSSAVLDFSAGLVARFLRDHRGHFKFEASAVGPRKPSARDFLILLGF